MLLDSFFRGSAISKTIWIIYFQEEGSGISGLCAPGWALLELCTILGEIGDRSKIPHIAQRACIRHIQLLFELCSQDKFEEDVHPRLTKGCQIVSILYLKGVFYGKRAFLGKI